MIDAARPASIATLATAPMLMPAIADGRSLLAELGMMEADADGEVLATVVDGGMDDRSGVRTAWVTDAAFPAEPDNCDAALFVVDPVLVIVGVVVRACVDVALRVGDVQIDDVVEASCCSLEVVSGESVVGEEPGIAGSIEKSLDARATRTPCIASITLFTVTTPVGKARTVSSSTSIKHPISPL